MNTTIQEIQKSFETMPFFQFIGFDIIDFDEDRVILKLEIRDDLLNNNHTLHGGIHASMIDQVLAMCIRAKTKSRCATISLNINYLAPITAGTVYATGRIVQLGYRITQAEGEVYTEDGTVLAKGIGSFKIIRE
ncbi:uncharacterized protein (TIGR00369 family) [Ureibacillus xyleni]|uniref:Uncharacterized protein (TIGR00369 family) n=1 Tax=Ureibacillus xyleni TaxID=614648 RepID=A0A285SE31_9BACL|nr:PaaI family thioesterase [Ureibacillus xyleni]SOC06135.1 uncharacterized protein (TIGR00369 family) [Ureibacillus xyleni]